MSEYKLFLIPILVLFINQIVKLIIEITKGNFSWYKLFTYGGMPSSHSSFVTSLVITLGYFEGLSSPVFALALVFALITVKDASGIRRKLGQQSNIINRLIKELPDKQEYQYPVLNERFGHSNLEVLVGIILSLVLTSGMIAWMN